VASPLSLILLAMFVHDAGSRAHGIRGSPRPHVRGDRRSRGRPRAPRHAATFSCQPAPSSRKPCANSRRVRSDDAEWDPRDGHRSLPAAMDQCHALISTQYRRLRHRPVAARHNVLQHSTAVSMTLAEPHVVVNRRSRVHGQYQSTTRPPGDWPRMAVGVNRGERSQGRTRSPMCPHLCKVWR